MKALVRRPRRNPWLRFARRSAGTAAAIVVLAACAGHGNLTGGTGSAPPPPQTPDEFAGRVTRVVDGDTFRISSTDERIRVWGLDAPETGEADGASATAALTSLIGGQKLTCRQRDVDRYGRIVGQCFLPDGRDLTAAMIASGAAEEFCRYSGNHYRTC
jgi:micrococcal nuclease